MSLRKIFQRIVTSLAFSGRDTTFFMKCGESHLICNLQKTPGSRSFYINGGTSYIALLPDEDLEQSPISAYGNQTTRFPTHADFRAENIPNTPINQAKIDEAASNQNPSAIEEIISIALESMINFTCSHGDREQVRRLKQAKKFPAIINKEVQPQLEPEGGAKTRSCIIDHDNKLLRPEPNAQTRRE